MTRGQSVHTMRRVGGVGGAKIPSVVCISNVSGKRDASAKKTGANFLSRSEHVFFFHPYYFFFLFFYPGTTHGGARDSDIQMSSTPPSTGFPQLNPEIPWTDSQLDRGTYMYTHTHTHNHIYTGLSSLYVYFFFSQVPSPRRARRPIASCGRFAFRRHILKICRRATKKKKNEKDFLFDLFVRKVFLHH